MKILGRTQMLETSTLAEAIVEIGALGFDGAEICLERRDWSIYRFDKEEARSAKEAADRAGLTYRSLSFHQDYIYNDEKLAETKRIIPLTPEVGADVFVFSGCKKVSRDEAEWDRVVARTRELVGVAEDSGVTLALEFEPDFVIGSTNEMLRLFEEVDSPCLCANLDLGHVFLVDDDPLASIRTLGEKIVHCHIENMGAGVHRHRLPWDGDMDLKTYIDALKNAEFTGGMALDMYDCDYAAVAAECISYLRKLI
jgi:sugar phosphate isomerase/epimerase